MQYSSFFVAAPVTPEIYNLALHGALPLLGESKARRVDAQSGQVDFDEAEAAETLERPGADLSGEELSVRVVPRQGDEFACSRCFLVHHITQLARGEGQKAVCKECA